MELNKLEYLQLKLTIRLFGKMFWLTSSFPAKYSNNGKFIVSFDARVISVELHHKYYLILFENVNLFSHLTTQQKKQKGENIIDKNFSFA